LSWVQNKLQRWSIALLAGFALTVVGGYAYKYIIETTSDYDYAIHWLETVPLVTLFIAFLLQREWAKKPNIGNAEQEWTCSQKLTMFTLRVNMLMYSKSDEHIHGPSTRG
jgi:hypothetical protein